MEKLNAIIYAPSMDVFLLILLALTSPLILLKKRKISTCAVYSATTATSGLLVFLSYTTLNTDLSLSISTGFMVATIMAMIDNSWIKTSPPRISAIIILSYIATKSCLLALNDHESVTTFTVVIIPLLFCCVFALGAMEYFFHGNKIVAGVSLLATTATQTILWIYDDTKVDTIYGNVNEVARNSLIVPVASIIVFFAVAFICRPLNKPDE